MTKREWSKKLFTKFPKGEIIPSENYFYFFENENDATKCFITHNKLDPKKACNVSISRYRRLKKNNYVRQT